MQKWQIEGERTRRNVVVEKKDVEFKNTRENDAENENGEEREGDSITLTKFVNRFIGLLLYFFVVFLIGN